MYIDCISINHVFDTSSPIHLILYMELKKHNSISPRNLKVSLNDRELDILTLLYLQGGISSNSELDEFSKLCFEKGFTKKYSPQAIRNIFTKARHIKFVKRKLSNNWKIVIIPNTTSDDLILKCLITTKDVN